MALQIKIFAPSLYYQNIHVATRFRVIYRLQSCRDKKILSRHKFALETEREVAIVTALMFVPFLIQCRDTKK